MATAKHIGKGSIITILVVVVLLAVGLGFAYDKHRTAGKLKPSAKPTVVNGKITFTDPSGLYAVAYPANWTASTAAISKRSALPLASQRLTQLVPAGSGITNLGAGGVLSDSEAVAVAAFQTTDAQKIITTYTSGSYHAAAQSSTINGYPALFFQDVYIGGSEDGSYIVDEYIVTHNNVSLLFTLRQKQTTPTSLINQYTDIVKSVKFLR